MMSQEHSISNQETGDMNKVSDKEQTPKTSKGIKKKHTKRIDK